MEAFAGLEHQVEVPGLPVAAHRIGEAIFQRTENGDQPGGEVPFPRDLAGEIFLADLAVGEKAERTARLLGGGLRGRLDADGECLGKGADVLEEDPAGVEVGFHDRGLIEMAQGSAQAQAVKPAQNSCDRTGKSCNKGRLGAGSGGGRWLLHTHTSTRTAGVQPFGCGSAALCKPSDRKRR